MSDTQDKIKEMARLTMLSNKLNDIQIKNLKAFPLIYFEGVQQVIMEYDLSNSMGADTVENKETLDIDLTVHKPETEHLYVSYRFEFEPIVKQIHLPSRFDALEKSVRSLLWNDVKVLIYFKDQLVYPIEMIV